MKNAIVQVDATKFKEWYAVHYGVQPGLKKRGTAVEPEVQMPCPSSRFHFMLGVI